MDLSDFVRRLRSGGDNGPGTLDAIHTQTPRPARMAAFPDWLHPALVDALHARGIVELYSHQRECADLLHAGQHAVIATSTASGKSLAYHLPVLDAVLRCARRVWSGSTAISERPGMRPPTAGTW